MKEEKNLVRAYKFRPDELKRMLVLDGKIDIVQSIEENGKQLIMIVTVEEQG